jgi:hypothetical protein
VKKRCTREGWLKPLHEAQTVIQEAKATVAEYREKRNVPAVPSAAEVLQKLGNDTRSKLAIGLNKGAQTVSEMDGQEVLMSAQQISQLTKAAGTVHGWESGTNSPSIRLEIINGQQPEAPVYDGYVEVSDAE